MPGRFLTRILHRLPGRRRLPMLKLLAIAVLAPAHATKLHILSCRSGSVRGPKHKRAA